jgi:excisionase family DNA binding protein
MSNASPISELMTTREAAEVLGVSVFQIARLARRGELEAAMQAPGRSGARFFTRAALDAFIAARSESGAA